jgi:NADPH-dependent 2,4-dienoyl-CoA reductase/sulfur reductase-like enzyme
MPGSPKSVAIIGAGPVGLAAAAHLLERGLHPVVLEAGEEIGHAVRQWGHVRMFSPWRYNVDKAAERLLSHQGWNTPDPDQYPIGAELVQRYLEPLARRTAIKDRVTRRRVSSPLLGSASTRSRRLDATKRRSRSGTIMVGG